MAASWCDSLLRVDVSLLLLGGVDVRSALLCSVLTSSAMLLFAADMLLVIFSTTAMLNVDLLCSIALRC